MLIKRIKNILCIPIYKNNKLLYCLFAITRYDIMMVTK